MPAAGEAVLSLARHPAWAQRTSNCRPLLTTDHRSLTTAQRHPASAPRTTKCRPLLTTGHRPLPGGSTQKCGEVRAEFRPFFPVTPPGAPAPPEACAVPVDPQAGRKRHNRKQCAEGKCPTPGNNHCRRPGCRGGRFPSGCCAGPCRRPRSGRSTQRGGGSRRVGRLWGTARRAAALQSVGMPSAT